MPSSKKQRGRQKKAKKIKKGAQQPPPQAGLTLPVPALLGEQLADATLATNRPGTEPTATLTPHAVRNMYTAMGNEEARFISLKPVLQVLQVGLKSIKAGEEEFWSYQLSDGANFFMGTLSPSLAHLGRDSSIKYSILRIFRFTIRKRPGGGRFCFISDAEVAGPNPGRAVGNPFWLSEDIIGRIAEMDYMATKHALTVFTQVDANFVEAGSLMRHNVVHFLLAMIQKGFRADCMTIKEKHQMDVLFNWFEILSAIVRAAYDMALGTICASIRPVLELFRAPVGVVPEIEYYGTTINYFMSLARLFKIVSGIAETKEFWRDDDFFEFACGAVFWHLDESTNPECHDALSDVSAAGSEFIRYELYSRAVEYCDRSLEFTAQLLSIANMRVCPDDSTFSSNLFQLIKEVSSRSVERDHHLMEVLRFFVCHDCVDEDMIRSIVELAGFFRKNNVPSWWDCPAILYNALRVYDYHGSSDRRMSIAVEAGLIELIVKMNDEQDDDTIIDMMKIVVDLLERGATRGSKLCLSMARVDVEELMRLSVVDVDGSFSHRIEQLVESARELCTRTCICCAASLGVGRIFRCDKCGTVYCSRVCQTKDWTKGGHKKTCSGYDGGHNGRGDRGGYDRGAPQVIAAYGARSTLRTLEELIAPQDSSMFEDSEDNDSRFSGDSVAGGIQVEGCGLSEINGYFRRVGFHDDCPKFCKMTTFRGREEVFSLFRCRLTDNTRRWYISIVPMNSQPGTTKDVDFYAAPALSHDDYPPAKSWMSVPHGGGIDPPPTLTFAI